MRRPGSSAATAGPVQGAGGAPPAATRPRGGRPRPRRASRVLLRAEPSDLSPTGPRTGRPRATPEMVAPGAPQSRAPGPPRRPRRRASMSSLALVQRPVFAAGSWASRSRPSRRHQLTTPAAGRDADPKGSTQGSCPRSAAPRREGRPARASPAGGLGPYGGGLEPAGADFMTLKRGSPRHSGPVCSR